MSKYISWIVIVAVVVLIVGGIVWYGDQPGKYDQFATCIKDSGASFFGAFWCPHCQAEKELFGRSWTNLPYVECSNPTATGQTQICTDNKIESYPTWYFPKYGTTTGVISLENLAKYTGCPVPATAAATDAANSGEISQATSLFSSTSSSTAP